MDERWYRYDADQDCGGSWHVRCFSFPVLKHTPKGVQLNVWGKRRFVLRDARKRYACPTVEEAKESFMARKRRQYRIYRTRALDLEKLLDLAPEIMDEVRPRAYRNGDMGLLF